MQPKYLIFFPIRRDIKACFPLQACTQPCLTASMEKYSHSCGQMYSCLRFHCVLHMPKPLILHRTRQISATWVCSQKQLLHENHTDQGYSQPELEEKQLFRKLGMQKQSRVFWEFCLLSSPLSYVIWKPYISMGYGYKSEGESPVFKQDTFLLHSYCKQNLVFLEAPREKVGFWS